MKGELSLEMLDQLVDMVAGQPDEDLRVCAEVREDGAWFVKAVNAAGAVRYAGAPSAMALLLNTTVPELAAACGLKLAGEGQ